jgi:hypothetical protein
MSKNYQVIKPEWIDKIKNSTFKTQDDSIFYNYIISPLCNMILQFIPSFIA